MGHDIFDSKLLRKKVKLKTLLNIKSRKIEYDIQKNIEKLGGIDRETKRIKIMIRKRKQKIEIIMIFH